MADFPFAGKTFEVRLDNGVIFHNTYAAEGNKLQYAEVDGAVEGASEEVDLYVAEVAPRTYLVGWNEVSGTSVTHLMDFRTKKITAFWSFNASGDRRGEMHTATFAQVQ